MISAVSYDKFQSQSINVKNENKIELPKPRKVKSARPIAKRIDAFLNLKPETINETTEQGRSLDHSKFPSQIYFI